MRKILFALAIMPLLIVACSSDDDSSTTDFDHNIEFLYGEWRATKIDTGVELDITVPINELTYPATYITFNKDGKYKSDGMLGENSGNFSTRGSIVSTKKFNFEVISLNANTAKVKINAKSLGLPEQGTVTVELTKNYEAKDHFDYEIGLLYGKWLATSLEGENVPNSPIDLTHPAVKPGYITFDKKGAFTMKSLLGESTGRYVAIDKTIHTLVDGERLNFEMSELDATTASIEIDPENFGYFGMESDLKDVKLATVVLTKEKE